jgi:hypothetical protein
MKRLIGTDKRRREDNILGSTNSPTLQEVLGRTNSPTCPTLVLYLNYLYQVQWNLIRGELTLTSFN